MVARPEKMPVASEFAAMMEEFIKPKKASPVMEEDDGDDVILGEVTTKMGVTTEEFIEAVRIAMNSV